MVKQRIVASGRSVKGKLLVLICPLVIILVSCLVFIAYATSAASMEEVSEELLRTSSKSQKYQIQAWLEENLSAFQAVKNTIEEMSFDDAQLQQLLDTYYGKEANYKEGFYIGSEDGAFRKAKSSKREEQNVLEARWYQEGLTRVSMAYGEPYVNSEGQAVITASGILRDKSGKTKVLAVDVALDKISIIVNSNVEMKSTQAFLVDRKDRRILSHRDNALVLQTLHEMESDPFLTKVNEKLGQKEYELASIEGNMVSFYEVEGTSWILVSYIPEEVVLANVVSLRKVMILAGAIAILVLAVLIERAVHVIIRPVGQLTQAITKMSGGDFTVEVETKGNDEIATMSRSVKEFIATMRAMIAEIDGIAMSLNGQADTSTEIAEGMYQVSSIQSESMAQLNQTVDQLSSSVGEIADNATTLAMAVSETKEDGLQVREKMGQAVHASEQGKKDMGEVHMAMDGISTSIEQLNEAINRVGDASQEITTIIDLIRGIAEETNLLSLNASIEAARAGEEGRGFVVVASEIGTLAKTSSEAVDQIAGLVGGINELVGDAISQSKENLANIEASGKLIGKTMESFDDIYSNINETDRLVNNMLTKVGEVDEVATGVAAISEEQAASAELILTTSEEMVKQAERITESSKQVSEDANSLKESSEELTAQMNQFTV